MSASFSRLRFQMGFSMHVAFFQNAERNQMGRRREKEDDNSRPVSEITRRNGNDTVPQWQPQKQRWPGGSRKSTAGMTACFSLSSGSHRNERKQVAVLL